MDTTYGKAVALAVPVFILLILVEIAINLYRRAHYYRLADAINSLSCGVASTGMRMFFGFLGIYTYEWTLTHAALIQLPAGHWATWIFAFLAYDLCYYWNHRLGHTVGLFWASHVVHHQSGQLRADARYALSLLARPQRLQFLADRLVRVVRHVR